MISHNRPVCQQIRRLCAPSFCTKNSVIFRPALTRISAPRTGYRQAQRRARQGAPPCASEQFQHPVAVAGAGRAVRLAGDDGRAGIERRLEPVRRGRAADVPQEHDLRAQDALGVGIVAHAALDHARGRAVDGLEHGVAVADVGAARRADTALQLRGLIGDDVAVEVRPASI